jgi:hypothetical protein
VILRGAPYGTKKKRDAEIVAGVSSGGEMCVIFQGDKRGCWYIIAGAISGGAQRVLRAGANNRGEMLQENRCLCSKRIQWDLTVKYFIDVSIPRNYNGI